MKGRGLTGCSAGEELRSSTGGSVCLTCIQVLIRSLMYCLIGPVLAPARYITKLWVLCEGSDVEDEGAQCEK